MVPLRLGPARGRTRRQSTRSELFREAFRRYVSSQGRRERILELGPRVVAAAGLDSEQAVDDAVDEAVRDCRRQRRQRA